MIANLTEITQDRGYLRRIQNFSKQAFSEKSEKFVAEQAPMLGAAYRLAGKVWRSVPLGSRLTSLTREPEQAFGFQLVRAGKPIEFSDELKVAQLIVAEEWLRDALDIPKAGDSAETKDAGPVLSMENTARALHCLCFHNAVLLTLSKVYEVVVSGTSIDFRLTAQGRKATRERRISMQMERGSATAVDAHIRDLVRTFTPDARKAQKSVVDCIPRRVWQDLERDWMDRYFCVGRYAEVGNPHAEHIKSLRAYCRWFVALEIARVAGEISLFPTEERIEAIGLDMEMLERIKEDRKHALGQDKAIHHQHGLLSLGNASVAHALGSAWKAAIPENSYQKFVEWLQKIHFPRYLISYLNPGDYEIGQCEIEEKKPKEKGNGYDCDLVIWERGRGLFFFIQSKLRRVPRFANIDAELDLLVSEDSVLSKGHRQIARLRSCLNEPRTQDQIQSAFPGKKIPWAELERRSHFILIHNTPELNAVVRDGIIMYEWNTFRNLLKRGTMRRVELTAGELSDWKTVHADGVLPIEDVEFVIRHSCCRGDADDHEFMQRAISDSLDASLSFLLPQEPAWGWRRLFQRPRSVTVPLL